MPDLSQDAGSIGGINPGANVVSAFAGAPHRGGFSKYDLSDLSDLSRTISGIQHKADEQNLDAAAEAFSNWQSEYFKNKDAWVEKVRTGQIQEFANLPGREWAYEMDAGSRLADIDTEVKTQLPRLAVATDENGRLAPPGNFDAAFDAAFNRNRSYSFNTPTGSRVVATHLPQLRESLRQKFMMMRLENENQVKKHNLDERFTGLARGIIAMTNPAIQAAIDIPAWLAGLPGNYQQSAHQAQIFQNDWNHPDQWQALSEDAYSFGTLGLREIQMNAMMGALGSVDPRAALAAIPFIYNLKLGNGTFGSDSLAIEELQQKSRVLANSSEQQQSHDLQQYHIDAEKEWNRYDDEWFDLVAKASPQDRPMVLKQAHDALFGNSDSGSPRYDPRFHGEIMARWNQRIQELEQSDLQSQRILAQDIEARMNNGEKNIGAVIAENRARLGPFAKALEDVYDKRQSGEGLAEKAGLGWRSRDLQRWAVFGATPQSKMKIQEKIDSFEKGVRDAAATFSQNEDPNDPETVPQKIKKKMDADYEKADADIKAYTQSIHKDKAKFTKEIEERIQNLQPIKDLRDTDMSDEIDPRQLAVWDAQSENVENQFYGVLGSGATQEDDIKFSDRGLVARMKKQMGVTIKGVNPFSESDVKFAFNEFKTKWQKARQEILDAKGGRGVILNKISSESERLLDEAAEAAAAKAGTQKVLEQDPTSPLMVQINNSEDALTSPETSRSSFSKQIEEDRKQLGKIADPIIDRIQHHFTGVPKNILGFPIGPQPTAPAPVNPAEFETKLSPKQESAFKDWKAQYAPKDSGQDYDLRGAFLAGLTPDKNGHFPDTYKKPNHPTFSTESIYAKQRPDLAGTWKGETFVPPKPKMTSGLLSGVFPQQTPDQRYESLRKDLLSLAYKNIDARTTNSPQKVEKTFGLIYRTIGYDPGDILNGKITVKNVDKTIEDISSRFVGEYGVIESVKPDVDIDLPKINPFNDLILMDTRDDAIVDAIMGKLGVPKELKAKFVAAQNTLLKRVYH